MFRDTKEDLQVIATHRTKERDYWLKKFSGELTKSSFPPDNKSKLTAAAGQQDFASVTLGFSNPAFETLMKLRNGSDPRLNMILATGVSILLHKYTGHEDIILGMPIYKQDIKAEFINTALALRNRVSRDMTFKELLLQVRQTIIEADENQNYPLRALVDNLNLPHSPGEFPLFDTAVLLENIHDKKHILHLHPRIIFSFHLAEDHLELVLEYNPLVYRSETMDRLLGHLANLMESALADVNQKIFALEILGDKEKHRLLVEFNRTAAEYPGDKTLNEVFEAQARRTPAETAVITVTDDGSGSDHCQSLSYGQLNEKANRLAWLLRAKGVKANSMVGLMTDRSLEMVIGMLGILKAGGAYLPIDTSLPRNRILAMLDDSGASLLISQGTVLDPHAYTFYQGIGNNRVEPYYTPSRKQAPNLDWLPLPDRSLVDYEKYHQYIGQVMVKDIIALQTARGCPYHCSYCSKTWSPQHVYRSAEQVFAELQLYYNMGVRRFSIFDDIFNVNIKNSSKFFQLIIEKGLDLQLFFPNGLRGDLLTPGYIDLMVEAGLVSTALALETASPRLQKLINKNLDLDKFSENVAYFCKKYPQVILELFSIHGFPTETEAEARMTLDFIKQQQWLHFPYVFILKIYPDTAMADLALQNGVLRRDILKSEDLAFHELSPTSPFDPGFTRNYQADFLNQYFLSKERLRHVLPYQIKVFTKDELVQKYDSYLPYNIKTFADFLELAGLSEEELDIDTYLEDTHYKVPDLNLKLRDHFPPRPPDPDALKVLFLDLSQYFSHESDILYDVVEPPLGGMYIISYLHQKLGNRVKGKILKSRIDFDHYDQLKRLLREFQPDVIGVRSLTFFRDFFHKTVALIRQWGYQVPLIAGGPYATRNSRAILQDKNIDLVVLNEGEVSFCEVVEKILANSGKLPPDNVLKEIPGIAFVPRAEAGKKVFAREIILLDCIPEQTAAQPVDNPPPLHHPADLAYIIFTSGSTGKPKGVMLEHRNAVNVLTWFGNHYNLQTGVHVLQLTNYSFDPSVEQLFATLFYGATVYIPDKERISDKEAFARFVRKYQIHIINFVPSVLKDLLDREEKLESLQAVISGGEKLDRPVKDRLLEKGYTLYNQYGPTETTIDALAATCTAGPVTLGKPIANARCYILGGGLMPMPLGVVGELVIGGAGVSRGYLNNPELTAEKFDHDLWDYQDYPDKKTKRFCRGSRGAVFSKRAPLVAEGRIYKTGDLARWLPDGTIEFFGRVDHQVKIRGHRIELGEVENQLLSHEDIKDAVVLTCSPGADDESDDGAGEIQSSICAYIVTARPTRLEEIKEYLAQHLPFYMIPSYFIAVEKIPLTANGKIHREALPSPTAAANGQEYTAPRNEIEENLATLWADVLEIEKTKISIDANFFQLGGNSLKATLMVGRLHKTMNIKLPMEKMFKTPRIKEIAHYIDGLKQVTFTSIQPVEKKEYYPLSSAQKRMFFFQQVNPQNTGYNAPQIIELQEKPDNEILENALKRLIKRHESLRTSFILVLDQPVQKINPEVPFAIQYSPPENIDAEEIKTRIMKDFVRPFDLSAPPLLRVKLLVTPDHKYFLLTDIHHIISDGVSYEITARDFTALYQDREMPPLRLQYKDFSQWQNGAKGEGTGKPQEEYWLSQFKAEVPVLNLPTDFPRPDVQSFTGGKVSLDLFAEDSDKIKEIALEERATSFMVLLAIYHVLLAKVSGQETIVAGVPVAGRRHADLENIIGMFVNTLPILSHPNPGKPFREFLQEIKEKTFGAFENQDFQFDELVMKLNLQGNLSRHPVFDVVFVMQNLDVGELIRSRTASSAAAGTGTTPYKKYRYKEKITKFDLLMEVTESNGKISLNLEYSASLFKSSTAQHLLEYYQEILKQVSQDKNIKLKDIELSDNLVAAHSAVLETDSGDFEL